MLIMRETKVTDERAERLRSAVQAVVKKLSEHCGKVRTLVNGFEVMQINNAEFSLDQPFYSTKSSLMMDAIKNLVRTYEALRREVRDVAQISYVLFGCLQLVESELSDAANEALLLLSFEVVNLHRPYREVC